jgi:glycosyltransferase involved in cell wall biosynthesis
VRFVLLSMARSGTHLLRDMLNAHRRIRCTNEVFETQGYCKYHLAKELGGWISQGSCTLAEAEQLNLHNPLEFIRRYGFEDLSAGHDTGGLTMMLDQPLTQRWHGPVWDWLSAQSDIRIVHLLRDNELLRFASNLRAQQTNEWALLGCHRSAARPVHVDPDAFLRQLEWSRGLREQKLALLAHHHILTVRYEELAADPAAGLARVCEFLEVEPIEPRIRTIRQSPRDIKAGISNLEELRARFAGTPVAPWLEPDQAPTPAGKCGTPDAAALARLTGLAKTRNGRVHLIGHIGVQDADILPQWLAHYRGLGVGDVHLILHGPPQQLDGLAKIARGAGAAIAEQYSDPFAEPTKSAKLTQLARRFIGEWVLVADVDEFLELPYPSLSATLRALRGFGMTSLPAVMVQRLARDGGLPAIGPGETLEQQFPLGSTLLVDLMADAGSPPCKTKHPLLLAHAGAVIRRGHHWAPDSNGVSGFGLQAVVHHYKWRSSLLGQLAERCTNPEANFSEMLRVASWLAAHDGHLPMAGAFPCSRRALLERGLLRRPRRSDIATAHLMHRLRLQAAGGAGGVDPARLALRLMHLNREWQAVGPPPAAAKALAMPTARIALVTFEMPPPNRTGGIGTWTAAAAASLRRLGHHVTIIYIPFHNAEITDFVRDVWASRGVDIIGIDRSELGPTTPRTAWPLSERLMQVLADRHFDIVHLSDAEALGLLPTAARRQGHAFQQTCFIATAHGTSEWHNRGNILPREERELAVGHAERLQIEQADAVISPSRAMIGWLQGHGFRLPAETRVHPNPLPHAAACRRREPSPIVPARRIVFFGRLEPRKGLSLFCEAIERLQGSLPAETQIVFLGRPGTPAIAEDLAIRCGAWRCRSAQYGAWPSEEAMLFLGEPGTLAVIPSLVDNYPYTVLECLGAGISFIATAIGGIPEMVHPADRERVLVAPEASALADAIGRALAQGIEPARPAFDFLTAELQWLAWQGQLMERTRSEPVRQVSLPGVAVLPIGRGEWNGGDSLESLRRQIGIELDMPADCLTSTWSTASRGTGALNDAAAKTRREFLLLCDPKLHCQPGAVAAMAMTAMNTGADAVLAGCRAPSRPHEEPNLHPPAGPLSLAALKDVFGGSFALVKQAAFARLGGLRERPELAGLELRDLLNRLLLQGGRIEVVPYSLYQQHEPPAPRPDRIAREALLEPFAAAIPAWAADLLAYSQDRAPPQQAERQQPETKAQEVQEVPDEQALQVLQDIQNRPLLAELMALEQVAQLHPSGDAELEVHDSGLLVRAKGEDPMLILPPLILPPGSPIHLVLEITSPAATDVQLFWATATAPDYSEIQSVRARIKIGRQIVALSTPPADFAGRLRLDPGRRPGVYQIHRLEVRAADSDAEGPMTSDLPGPHLALGTTLGS